MSQSALLGTNFRDYLHLSDRRTLRSIYRRMQANGRAESSIRIVRPDKIEVAVWLTMLERADGGFFASIRDITQQRLFERELEESIKRLHATQLELKQANTQLRVLATTDGLTGLINHREFQVRLAQQVDLSQRYDTSFSVIMLDVDSFKVYNDDFGHPAGDLVLRSVAECLQREARRSDTVARYGGEEFAILLPATDSEGAGDLAERMRIAISSLEWTHRCVTASFGVATFKSFPSASAVLNAADRALYEAKEQGRNRVSRAVS
jgi:diguanylate cyclase (GGDEF)-like protein